MISRDRSRDVPSGQDLLRLIANVRSAARADAGWADLDMSEVMTWVWHNRNAHPAAQSVMQIGVPSSSEKEALKVLKKPYYRNATCWGSIGMEMAKNVTHSIPTVDPCALLK